MCSGRVDLEFILRAFSNGLDGVLIGGCRLNECNYVTHGNYDALGNTHIFSKLLGYLGVNPERLKIEFMSAGDGIHLARIIDDFVQNIKEIGPLGKSEGIDINELKFKFEALKKIVPYIKLVERERLRIPFKSEEAYNAFFASEEVNRLFDELICDKLVISQIMLLLGQKPRSTVEISEILDLNPSEVSRHLSSSSRYGLVSYDSNRQCYAIA